MIRGFPIILAFQLVGELLAHLLSLPVPGPVIGMGLNALATALLVPALVGWLLR